MLNKDRVLNAWTRQRTRLLELLGLRGAVLAWRSERRRRRRSAAEKRGDDRLSRPALHELDVKLSAIIDKRDGYFVEAGAHDGFTQSNTYWLERFRDWRGLLVEPMLEMAAEARVTRPQATVIQCALVAADDPRSRVPMRFGDLYSMVDGAKDAGWISGGTILGWRDPYETDVDARTLSSILDAVRAPEVDLLSLDTEGFEASVLRGLDLERHAPRYLLVEIHDRDRDRPPIDEALGDRYAEYGWLSPVDLLYVRTDVASSGTDGKATTGIEPVDRSNEIVESSSEEADEGRVGRTTRTIATDDRWVGGLAWGRSDRVLVVGRAAVL